MRFCKYFGRALTMTSLYAAPVQATPSCYPTFKAETSYKAGTTVSASIVEHTTQPCAPDLTHQADNKTSLCNADGTRPVAITRTYNYRCVDGPKSLYCQQGWAFDPASLYGHVAWEKLEECYNESALFPNTWSAGDGCPAEYDSYNDGIGSYSSHYDPGDLVSVPLPASERSYGESKVYRCKDQGFQELDHHRAQISQCGQVGFEPDGFYGELVWEFLGNCTGTLPPPELVLGYWGRRCPDPWIEMDWVPGHLPNNTYEYATYASYYEPGDLVSEGNVVYQCRRFPDYRHCGQAGYRPPKSPATPGAWKDAWTPQGICDLNNMSTAPTSSPSFDVLDVQDEGCPEVWHSSTNYYSGDQVSLIMSNIPMRRIVYQCRGHPYEGYCNQEAFQPGTKYDDIPWTVIGACDNTMAPTQSPSVYGVVCDYTKCTAVPTPCRCDSSDCPNPLGLAVGCTKTIETCESKDVEPYSSTQNYDYGDVVRVGLDRYVCLGYPFGLWCNNPSYKPGLVDGIWSNAWRQDGVCPASASPSQSPSKAPSTSPSQSPSKEPSTSPSKSPSKEPSSSPSQSPSREPSTSPTRSPSPSQSPSRSPSKAPTPPSTSPTPAPTPKPTTPAPTPKPTTPAPTPKPTAAPTADNANSSPPTGSPVCTGVDISFGGSSTQITENNIGGRDPSNSNKFAMITNVGSYNGQSFHLKLESALASGDDPNCSSGTPADKAKCSIEISSNGAVTFMVKANKIHPIKFTLIGSSNGNPIIIPRFSFSMFDVGAKGSEFFWTDGSFSTFACGGCQDSCCPVGTEPHTLTHDSIADITANGETFTGGQRFNSNPLVINIPNVEDPLSLTPFQQSQSVRFVYADTSDFIIAFGRANGGLRQQFSGYTNIGANVC